MVLSGYIGDSRDALGLDLYADVDWAGDWVDYKSTSGAIIFLSGANSRYPFGAKCAKQTITSFSTPESERVAANMAVRMLGIPFLGACEKFCCTTRKTEACLQRGQSVCASGYENGQEVDDATFAPRTRNQ